MQLNREKTEAKNQMDILQEELNTTRTKLAEIQIVQTEVQQTRSAAYSKISALNAEIQRLQQTIEELQQRENRADEIFALETQVSIFISLITKFELCLIKYYFLCNFNLSFFIP